MLERRRQSSQAVGRVGRAVPHDKPISGVTVADLGRDGMLTRSTLDGNASARLTTRGNWFARTAVTEMAERSGSVM